jgi:putative heme-binding domain-containing protein
MDITAPADAKLGRILCLHPGGRWTVFATNLHAVFGLQYLEGKLYVLHNPKFTAFRDGGDIGTDREDLIEQTNPNPWALDWNDHIPSNFRLGMDGYFYVAVGDKGLYQCKGRDGSVVNLHGGGILRLRPDATALEIFCTGTRNILDVAMNAEDDFFTYDNTDEHQWMGRLTHMVESGFYGYPYDFIPQRLYTLWMMHDFGAGAACGTLAYNEDALPAEYRGNLFLADFGKRQVTRVRIERDGGTYRVASNEELFHDQPEDFRPVGLAFAPDARSFYICDWQHRDVKSTNASVGRVWRLTWTGESRPEPKPRWYLPLALGQSTNVPAAELVAGLSHLSHAVRMTAQRALVRSGNNGQPRLAQALVGLLTNQMAPATARWHALWALDQHDGGKSAQKAILATASDEDASVARQAIRQLGQRRMIEAVPVLTNALQRPEASVRFHAATALGRIAETNAVPALVNALVDADLFARYAVFTALNRIGRSRPDAWPAILIGLNSPNARVREATAFTPRDTFDGALVAELIGIVSKPESATEARELALKSLAALHHEPAPWRGEWWAYHPAKAPPPERNHSWAGTPTILETLRASLTEDSLRVRLIAIEGLAEARDTNAAPLLREAFVTDTEPAIRRAALNALARLRDAKTAPALAAVLRTPGQDTGLLTEAVRLAPQFGGSDMSSALIQLLRNRTQPESLRLTAIDALSKLGGEEGASTLRDALQSPAIEERRAALRGLGQLRDKASVSALLVAWRSLETRADALAALCRVGDVRALDAYLEGLASADPVVREQCRKALMPLRNEALPQLESRTALLSAPVLSELRRVYGYDAGALKNPLFASNAKLVEVTEYEQYALAHKGDAANGERIFFNEQGVACGRCHVIDGRGGNVGPDLTLAGAQFSRAQLIESILHPSRAVREGYQQIVVETKDDEMVSGALKADTADGLTLVDSGGRTNFVPRAGIVNRRTSELSLMPDGLQVGLTLGEFADLIAYLESRRTAGAKTSR